MYPSTHYESVGDSSESCSEVCIMVEHDFYLMSKWMCGPGVTPLLTCVPESMSNYPIIRLSVMYEDVAVYDLIVILRLIERLVVISIILSDWD